VSFWLKSAIACVALLATKVAASDLVSFTGIDGRLIGFDCETLQLTSGSLEANSTFPNHVAFSDDGRLFGFSRGVLKEFNPSTLAVLNERNLSGTLHGLEAYDGLIYSITGMTSEPVALDMDTFEVAQGVLLQGSVFGDEFTGDGNGRLFGLRRGVLAEFDRETFVVLNERTVGGSLIGITAYEGKLVAFTGTAGEMVTIDADTLEVTSGTLSNRSTVGMALAFDYRERRLFAVFQGTLSERDPDTLVTLNEVTHSGGTILGLAAQTLPPPGEEIHQITTVTRDSMNRIRLTIPPTFRRDIGIEYSPDLSPGSWIELGNFSEVRDEESTFVDADTARTLGQRGFYRAFLRPLVE